MRASRGGTHVSGAEGLYEDGEVEKAVRDFLRRAEVHARGEPDSVTLSIEKLRARPREITALKVATLECRNTAEARSAAMRLLEAEGISRRAIKAAFGVVTGERVMRGASAVSSISGRRLEPDKSRGVRASRLGIAKGARAALGRKLTRRGINTGTVREALALASKTASCKGVLAELCVSDDPHYTTGYVASTTLGYVRIPNIKKKGSPRGGRVYFVRDGADIKRIASYLEKTPVLVSGSDEVKGECRADELLRSIDS